MQENSHLKLVQSTHQNVNLVKQVLTAMKLEDRRCAKKNVLRVRSLIKRVCHLKINVSLAKRVHTTLKMEVHPARLAKRVRTTLKMEVHLANLAK